MVGQTGGPHPINAAIGWDSDSSAETARGCFAKLLDSTVNGLEPYCLWTCRCLKVIQAGIKPS